MTLTSSSDHGSTPNGCTVSADLREWLLPHASTQQEKKTPAEMVAMNRVRPENQTASTPQATKVAGESPQNLLNLLNLFRETEQHLDNLIRETDQHLDNLLKETNQHLDNPPVGKPVDDPEVTVEEKKKDPNEVKASTDKSGLPAAPQDNSTKAAPAGTESVSAARSGNTRRNRTRSHEKGRNTEKRKTISKKSGPPVVQKKSSKSTSTA